MPRRKNPEYSDPEIKVSSSGEAAMDLESLSRTESLEEEITEENLTESKPSVVLKFLQHKVLPAVLEGSHDALLLFNKGVDYAAKAVNRIVPAVSETLVGFILPENFGRIINKTVEYSTKGTTFVGKGLAKTALNVFTFGAPAWIDAFRQHLAVKEGNEKYEKVESSQDLLAVNYLDHLKDEKLKDTLNEYYDARKELAEARKNPEKNAERIAELSETIANYEVNYKDCVDFSNLKAMLEKGKEFMDSNEALISELAGETADKMIANVENFYKDKFGRMGDKVEGKWLGIITSPEKGREQLVKEITERLKLVMSKELDKEAVQMEIKRVNSELFSEFGVYRKYFKAGIYTILRELPAIKAGLENLGVWERISTVAHQGLGSVETAAKAVGDWAGHGIKNVGNWLWGQAKELSPEHGEDMETAVKWLGQLAHVVGHPIDALGETMSGISGLAKNYFNDLKESTRNILIELVKGHLDVPTNIIEEVKQVAVSNTLDNWAAAAKVYGEATNLPVPEVPEITGAL